MQEHHPFAIKLGEDNKAAKAQSKCTLAIQKKECFGF